MLTRHPDIDVRIGFVPSKPERPRVLSHEQVDAYNRDGFVSSVKIYEPTYMDRLRGFFDNDFPELENKLTDKRFGFQAFHHLIPELYDFVTHPRIVGAMQDLLGGDLVCHTSAYINKPPGQARKVPWHQDCTYNPMDSRCVVAWIAIDDADIDNGCMWCIPGGHLHGQLEFDQTPYTDTSFGALETRDAESLGKAVPAPLKSGEVLFFSDLVPHQSLGNTTRDRHRRSFNVTYANTALRPYHHKGSWAVLCGGRDPEGNWFPHHARPR